MRMPRFSAAWHTLWNEPPTPHLGDQVELYRRDHTGLRVILKRAALVLLVGVLILAVALAWESLAWQVMPTPTEHHPESLAAELFTAHLWRRVLYEAGFAFLIAAVVTSFIEYNAMREQQGLLARAIQDIGHSVIEGVYRIRHTNEYIRTVVNSCLAVRHVRKDYNVMCEVYDFTGAECVDLGITFNTLVRITADLKYDAINIGHDYAIFQGKYYIPRRRGKLEDFAKVTELQVGDKVYTAAEIEAAEIKPDDPNYISSDRSYTFPIYAHPDRPVPVHIRSTFVKERSDNEIFVFLHPTIGASIKFFFHMAGLRIGAKTRTATDSPDAHTLTEGYVEWKVAGPLLPNNYVTVWWRSAADDGEPELGEEVDRLHGPVPMPRPQIEQPSIRAAVSPQGGTTPPTEGLQPERNSVRGLFRWLSPSYWRRE